MGGRVRGAAVVVVVLVAGAFLGSAVSQWWGWGALGAHASAPGRGGARVRVEVLNAGGSVGAARGATDRLRDSGFDVVFFGNAGAFDRDSSVVLDRTGRVESARGVADALGIRNVRSEPDSNLYLDVSVLLGKDWAPPEAPPVDARSGSPRRPWWDPRGWLKR
jgi:LytR cell envelope-related transcriptional attenuator